MATSGYTREAVQERLLRTAAETWGTHGTHAGHSDPLVRLILGAVALEMERIGQAIHDSDARVFERIARYLLPEVMVRAEPSHAIARFLPSSSMLGTRYEELHFEKVVRRKENLNRPETRVHGFSIAGDIALSGTRILLKASGNMLAAMSAKGEKRIAAIAPAMDPHVVYLGFQGTFGEQEVVRLFLDWPGHGERSRCLAAVGRITAHDIHGNPLAVGVGLPSWVDEEADGDLELTMNIERRVRAYYHDHFLRIRVGRLPEGVPNEAVLAEESVGGKDARRSRWLRIDFPTDIGPELVRSAVILDNCAPVVNRKLEKAIFRLQHEVNIKRLNIEGEFLAIEKAESSKGQRYIEVPSAEQVDATPGTFTVRHGASARFDERDAGQLLRHAVEQVREETRAFAAMDVASTVTDLRSIEQAVARIERRLSELMPGKPRTYMAMRPFDRSDTAHLHFWTTDGIAAEGIASGTILRSLRQGLDAEGEVRLVTPVVGARTGRTSKELVQQYRAAVLGRGRIVTRRDIIEHCRLVCGSRLKSVTVDDGVMVSPEPAKGLVRCLNAVLAFEPGSVSDPEASYFKERLHADLNSASGLSLPIRIP